MKRARVLIVDDKESFLALFRRIAPPDLDVVCVSDGKRALERLTTERFDLVVSDIRMPGLDGLALLSRIRETRIDVEVVLMTAYGTIADAVRAMKYGAADYLTKPFDPDDAVAAIEQALSRRGRRPGASDPAETARILGQTAAMKPVLELIERAAGCDATVLISGESGTGRELVANAIHAKSPRASRRFVAVNCGAFPEASIDHELFGLEEAPAAEPATATGGAFGAAAGGTLFLDEVGELPQVAQEKLARALQQRVRNVESLPDHAADVRVIAATHEDLRLATAEGRFRDDLFRHLNGLVVTVPPLRDRRADIPALADVLLARLTASDGRARRLSPEALACLVSYDWPGNVRQLENALARAAAVATGDELSADALPSEVRGADTFPSSRPLASLPYREAIAAERERATREYLIALLRDVNGNVTQAAERAGIERESFHRLMKRHNVRAEDYRAK